MSLEEKMRRAEEERRGLEEARQKALEAKEAAEIAASLEKEERERKVCDGCTYCLHFFATILLL